MWTMESFLRGQLGLLSANAEYKLSPCTAGEPFPAIYEMGCNLVITKSEVSVLNEDGTRETVSLTFEDAKAFAQQAAAKFGVGPVYNFVYDEGKALAKLGKQAEASIKKAEKKNGKAKAAKTTE